MGAPALVRMRGIDKRFAPDVHANRAIDLEIHAGEIHALLGENGAGKSTLMQILYGMQQPDRGEILIEGAPVRLAGSRAAIAHGIGMIHQEFMLVNGFTVAENVAMGAGGRLDLAAVAARVSELARRFGLAVEPSAPIADLPLGVRQRVEILKLLFREARVLILDEPTAVLTPQEAGRLFAVLRALADAGRAVVVVTHKLREVIAFADRITVLRDGAVVGRALAAQTDERSLARLMVGRDVVLRADRRAQPPGRCLLDVDDLAVERVRVSLRVHAGEILGIAGVDGNGQSELAEALFGLRPATGRVALDGHDIAALSPAARRARGLAYLPADRRHVAAVGELSIADNAVLGAHAGFARWGGTWRDGGRARVHAARLMARFGVRAPSAAFTAGKLSGGNLQKLVLGREVMREPAVLIVEQPTRGLDVGAIETIWAELLAQRAQGRGLLLISAELDEILNLSDRIAVLFDGRLMGILDAADADAETLGRMMAGTELTAMAA